MALVDLLGSSLLAKGAEKKDTAEALRVCSCGDAQNMGANGLVKRERIGSQERQSGCVVSEPASVRLDMPSLPSLAKRCEAL